MKYIKYLTEKEYIEEKLNEMCEWLSDEDKETIKHLMNWDEVMKEYPSAEIQH